MLTAPSLLNASPSDIVTFGNNRHLVGLSIRDDLRDAFEVCICRSSRVRLPCPSTRVTTELLKQHHASGHKQRSQGIIHLQISR
jgi:hypothetical protein